MGQNLMSPPNVKGWPGGETWINTTTLLARKQYLDRITRAGDSDPFAMIAASVRAIADDASANAPKRALAPQGVADDDKARQQRFLRQMERGLASLDFDSARWMAQFPGTTAAERARAAQQLAARDGAAAATAITTPIRARSCTRSCSTPPTSSNDGRPLR